MATDGKVLKTPSVARSALTHANARGWAASPLDGLSILARFLAL
jgi:hypothetical protein